MLQPQVTVQSAMLLGTSDVRDSSEGLGGHVRLPRGVCCRPQYRGALGLDCLKCGNGQGGGRRPGPAPRAGASCVPACSCLPGPSLCPTGCLSPCPTPVWPATPGGPGELPRMATEVLVPPSCVGSSRGTRPRETPQAREGCRSHAWSQDWGVSPGSHRPGPEWQPPCVAPNQARVLSAWGRSLPPRRPQALGRRR